MAYALHEYRDENQLRRRIVVASGINLAMGLWLAVAPFALSFEQPAALWNSVAVGITVAALAAGRVFGGHRVALLSWINVALGIWLIISPWLIGGVEEGAVFWNHMIGGITIASCASSSALSTPVPEV